MMSRLLVLLLLGCISADARLFRSRQQHISQDQEGMPEDCRVSSWSDWSICAKPCQGSQTRTRTVLQQAQKKGAACPALTETRDCGPAPGETCVYCEVSSWSEWSQCAKPCQGFQTRSRTIVRQLRNNPADCPALKETRDCGPAPGGSCGWFGGAYQIADCDNQHISNPLVGRPDCRFGSVRSLVAIVQTSYIGKCNSFAGGGANAGQTGRIYLCTESNTLPKDSTFGGLYSLTGPQVDERPDLNSDFYSVHNPLTGGQKDCPEGFSETELAVTQNPLSTTKISLRLCTRNGATPDFYVDSGSCASGKKPFQVGAFESRVDSNASPTSHKLFMCVSPLLVPTQPPTPTQFTTHKPTPKPGGSPAFFGGVYSVSNCDEKSVPNTLFDDRFSCPYGYKDNILDVRIPVTTSCTTTIHYCTRADITAKNFYNEQAKRNDHEQLFGGFFSEPPAIGSFGNWVSSALAGVPDPSRDSITERFPNIVRDQLKYRCPDAFYHFIRGPGNKVLFPQPVYGTGAFFATVKDGDSFRRIGICDNQENPSFPDDEVAGAYQADASGSGNPDTTNNPRLWALKCYDSHQAIKITDALSQHGRSTTLYVCVRKNIYVPGPTAPPTLPPTAPPPPPPPPPAPVMQNVTDYWQDGNAKTGYTATRKSKLTLRCVGSC
eukprot:TRINITY_DN2431_c0_g1_i8.p1 TRINITY_DN2431_c0_g1~~TRINITY_DN2431_c0_g1_i8.p1  ORF type:complete len:662 (+),score=106.45 TRINITY_DN2431_c0_g1_i8:49-2034(+)